MKTPVAVKALAALAQDSRLAVFRLLVEQGPDGLPAGVIAERLALPSATLSFHLKELASASLVSARQQGRFIYYAASFGTMNALIAYLTENCCQGGGCAPGCVPVAAPTKRRKTPA